MAVLIIGRKENPYDGKHKGVYIRFSLGKQVWSVYRDGVNIGREVTLDAAYDYAERVDSGEVEPQPNKVINDLKSENKTLEFNLVSERAATKLLREEVEQLRNVNVELRKTVEGLTEHGVDRQSKLDMLRHENVQLHEKVQQLGLANEAIDKRNTRLSNRLSAIRVAMDTQTA